MEKQISFFILGFVAALSMASLFTLQKQKSAGISPFSSSPTNEYCQYTLNLDPVARAISLNLLDHLHQDSPGPMP